MRKFPAKFMIMFLSMVLAAGGLGTSGTAVAQESAKSKTFVVVGSANIHADNVSAARENAIADGLVTAVALMTEELLQKDSFVEQFEQLHEILFEKTSSFVTGYKVLAASTRKKTYHVVVQATVSGGKTYQYLSDAGILKIETTLPSVLLAISEQKLDEPYPGFWWGPEGTFFESLATAKIIGSLREAGFLVIDHKRARSRAQINWDAFNKPELSDQEAAELGVLLKADVVVTGNSVVNPSTNIMGSTMRSFNGTVNARVVRTQSAELLLNLNRTSVAVSEDDISGSRSALEDVGGAAGAALAEELTAAWQKQAGKPSLVSMVIRGTEQLSSYVKFRKSMNTISGVEGIRVKGIKPNEATLLVEYKGKTSDLAASLMQQNFDTFGINIFEVTEDMVRVELIPQ
jgi:hypothetical protein